MSESKQIQVLPESPVRTNFATIVALVSVAIVGTTGFMVLKGDVAKANDNADFAIKRVDKLESKLDEILKVSQADHDKITRIDENVKILRRSDQK